MKFRVFFLFFSISIFFSCSISINNIDCANQHLKITPHYYESMSHGSETYFVHYLYVEGYNEECFNNTDFIKICEQYVDTVNTNVPVYGIGFYKSIISFPTINDEQDWKEINKDAILMFGVNRKLSVQKILEINSITFYNSGEEQTIHLK
ncbi:MAG: hypothetical protein AB7G44_10920 [Bacteroidia bacterium]